MGKVMAIHSSRGGTGKSLIAVNLAAMLAREGRSVSLFDLDFRAPSLFNVFGIGDHGLIDHWMNDFLDGRCSIDEVVRDVSGRYDTKGRFLVGFANPTIDAIRGMMRKDRRWERDALRRLLALKPVLLNGMKLDYAIYDTSPGFQYSSVNAVVSSDISVVVTTMDALDIEGARYMLNELYDAFGKRAVILMNKAFPGQFPGSEGGRAGVLRQLKETFACPVMGIIPCYCDILQSSRMSLFVLETPDHPFTKALEEVVEKLEGP